MSSSGGGSTTGGSGGKGILRSSSKKRSSTMEVTFGGPATETISRPTRPSPSDQEYAEVGGGRTGEEGFGNGNISNSNGSGGGGGYDSDDLYDASMAAGGALPSALSADAGDTNTDGRPADGLPRDRAGIDAARRQRRRRAAGAGLAGRAEEIERIEEDDEHDHSSAGNSSNKMGPAGGADNDGNQIGRKGQFRGEEDPDAGLSLLASSSAPSTTAANPADPSAISGAYDAGSNAACPVEPFNLKAEREGGEGYFDGDTYVFRRLEDGGRAIDEEPDAWLDELGGRDADGGGSGGGAGVARLSNAKGTTKKQPTLDLDGVSHEELCSRIASLLAAERETVSRGLKRYGDVIARDRKRKQKLATKRRQQRSKKGGEGGAGTGGERNDGKMDADDSNAGVAAAQRALADLTDLADALLMGGDGEVYSRTKEELLRMASASGGGASEEHVAGQKRKRNYFGGGGDANGDEGNEGSSKMAKTDGDGATGAAGVRAEKQTPVQWEYRGNQDQQIHGPYTTEQMLGWIQAGYFVGEAAVDVRRVASADNGGGAKDAAEKATADDLMADLMDSDDDDEGGGDGKKETPNAPIEWERSDKVDFKSYL